MPATAKKSHRKSKPGSKRPAQAVRLTKSRRATAVRRALPKANGKPRRSAPRPAPPAPAEPILRVRRDQSSLTAKHWADLIAALRELRRLEAPAPNYADFTRAYQHGYHQHQAHGLPYFLPWHREYLWHFESRLQRIHPKVTLPYWNWLTHPKIPSRLDHAGEWGVTRLPNVCFPETARDAVAEVMKQTNYNSFSTELEALHQKLRPLVGGQMALHESEPQDVIFWLYHAFLDKLWADWQAAHPKADPTSAAYDIWLKPQVMSARPLFTHKAREMWKIGRIGYGYR